MKKINRKSSITLAIITSLFACAVNVDSNRNIDNCEMPATLSNWTFQLNSFTIYHTRELETMALRGAVGGLNSEYCDAGKPAAPGSIPPNDSDIEMVSYAPILDIDGYYIAMYHPTSRYPDNWIMYNQRSNEWCRYDLGENEGPGQGIRLLLHSQKEN